MNIRAFALVALVAVGLAGCDVKGNDVSERRGYRSEPIEMTIMQVNTKSSCIGTDFETIIASEDHRVAKLCGDWGKPGDKISGCWESGNSDYDQDGFRRICRQ